MYVCCVAVLEPTADEDVERKRHISAPDESHSDSESTTLRLNHEPSATVQLLPRPRSSTSLHDFIDSSTRTPASVEQLVSSIAVCTTSFCTILSLFTASILIAAASLSSPLSFC